MDTELELVISRDQIGDYPNYHQRAVIQYLTEADADTHNQTLDQAWRNSDEEMEQGL